MEKSVAETHNIDNNTITQWEMQGVVSRDNLNLKEKDSVTLGKNRGRRENESE